MKKFACLLTLLVLPAVAKESVFTYDGFYARLKKSEQAQYSQVTLTFLLRQQNSDQVCKIDQAQLTTDLVKQPLILASNGELLLPYDEEMNDNKAKIRLQQPDDAVPCDLNFRLRNKLPLQRQLALSEVKKIHQQFDQLMDEMAGIAKYMLPEIQGVTVLFSQPAQLVTPVDYVQCQALQCTIDLNKAPADAMLTFTVTPDYIVPWIPR
jgi:hypothetical protein